MELKPSLCVLSAILTFQKATAELQAPAAIGFNEEIEYEFTYCRTSQMGFAGIEYINSLSLMGFQCRLCSSSGDSLSTTSGDREGPSDSLPRRLFFDDVLKVDSLPSIPEER